MTENYPEFLVAILNYAGASTSAVSKPVKDDYDEPEPPKSRPVSAALSDSGDE
jgi:hypothetical protein